MLRPFGLPRALPMGAFAGNPPVPHDPTAAAVDALHDALTGDPGLRLAGSRGKRQFRAGGLTPQQFIGPQGGPATDEVLQTLGSTRIQRRAMGQFRGFPDPPPSEE